DPIAYGHNRQVRTKCQVRSDLVIDSRSYRIIAPSPIFSTELLMPSRPTAGDLNRDNWPIAVCMHGFSRIGADGTALHDAPAETWDAMFGQVAALGFNAIELADSHIRPADLTASRRTELREIATSHGVTPLAVHVQRQSVIEPGRGEENLAYAHRSIEAAAEL